MLAKLAPQLKSTMGRYYLKLQISYITETQLVIASQNSLFTFIYHKVTVFLQNKKLRALITLLPSVIFIIAYDVMPRF